MTFLKNVTSLINNAMDKIKKYKKIAIKVVKKNAKKLKNAFLETEIIPIIDKKRGQFLLYENGWEGTTRLYNCIFLLDNS